MSTSTKVFNSLKIIFLVYLMLLAVTTLGAGFKWLSGGAEGAKELFAFATNPFMGLLIGVLATALVQSSSTVTSVIVGLVAGGLSVKTAIPMIMGANIGTTITNSIVSLSYLRTKERFKEAFAAATVHDFFNFMAVILFFPLEMAFGILDKVSAGLATVLMGTGNFSIKSFNFIKPLTKPVASTFKTGFQTLPDNIGPSLMILFGLILVVVSISFLNRALVKGLGDTTKSLLEKALTKSPLRSMFSGVAITTLVQSSSTTTSLTVPLVGSGHFKIRDVYPFILGANIGTCVTALLVATAATGSGAIFALQIALVHLLFNVSAVAVIYGLPILREIPIAMATALAQVSSDKKRYAFGYVIGAFFVLPGLAYYLA